MLCSVSFFFGRLCVYVFDSIHSVDDAFCAVSVVHWPFKSACATSSWNNFAVMQVADFHLHAFCFSCLFFHFLHLVYPRIFYRCLVLFLVWFLWLYLWSFVRQFLCSFILTLVSCCLWICALVVVRFPRCDECSAWNLFCLFAYSSFVLWLVRLNYSLRDISVVFIVWSSRAFVFFSFLCKIWILYRVIRAIEKWIQWKKCRETKEE